MLLYSHSWMVVSTCMPEQYNAVNSQFVNMVLCISLGAADASDRSCVAMPTSLDMSAHLVAVVVAVMTVW